VWVAVLVFVADAVVKARVVMVPRVPEPLAASREAASG